MLKRLSVLVPALLCAGVLAASAANVRVKVDHTPMRAGASPGAAVVLELRTGAVLDVLDADRDWYRVRDPKSGREGFVPASAVELQPGPAAQGAAGQKAPAGGGTTDQPARAAAPKRPPSKGDWTDRGYFSIGGFYETGVSDFTQTQQWASFAETATVGIVFPATGAAGFDVEGGYRLWRNMAVGLGLTAVSRSTTATVSGSLPNPIYLNRPVAISGSVDSSNSQLGIHLQAAWVIPMSPRMNLMLFGGPSIFSVKQTIVEPEGVTLSSGYPFDSGTVTAATTEASKTAFGFGAGADVGYFFSKSMGVGGMVRYTWAPVSFPVSGQPSVEMHAGGFQVGAGLRVRIPARKAGPAKPPAPPRTQPTPDAPLKK